MSLNNTPNEHSVRTGTLKWVSLVAVAFLITLVFVPPHMLDDAIARAIWHAFGEDWAATSWPWLGTAYRATKIVTAGVVLFVIVFGVLAWLKGRKQEVVDIARLVLAIALSLLTVVLLKDWSGVACPWSLAPFADGSSLRQIAPFEYIFDAIPSQGRCWPAGHAGAGFCLFGLYFYARKRDCRGAGFVLFLVLTYGVLCAAVRMLDGAHFFSHGLATALIDWVVSAFVFGVFGQCARSYPISRGLAGFVCAIVMTSMSVPFFSRAVAYAGQAGIVMALTFALLLLVLWYGMFRLLIGLMPRYGWRIALGGLGLVGAVSNAYFVCYGTIMTPDMVRNALSTDWHEAVELLSWRHVGLSCALWMPAFVSAWTAPTFESNKKLSIRRYLTTTCIWVCCLFFALGLILSQMGNVASFMRNQKDARYQIMPAATVYSMVRTLSTDARPGERQRAVIDPQPVQTPVTSERPLLVVLYVGETARAADWGLAGYERRTTPQLRLRKVLSLNQVTACGTSTDVSLPCMFSRIGRSDYDRDKILSQESMLSVIQRAGVSVRWVDNQSGCKGACTPKMLEPVVQNERDCSHGRCMDGAMLGNIKNAISRKISERRQLLVLHMMGSHGPAYWRRVPEGFAPFGQGCRKDDIGACSPQQVRDSYDNSIAYTDKVLADAIDVLNEAKGIDTVLLYVSDHGESLGEKGLWLHGAPYFMAPSEQTHVPMILWMNETAKQRFSVDEHKLGELKQQPLSHDNLVDTLLGAVQVHSAVYQETLDLFARIRSNKTKLTLQRDSSDSCAPCSSNG